MLELNADLRPIISMAQRFKNTLVVGCVGTIGGATIGIYRLRQLYDTHEIIAMGVAVIAVSACGRYALIKTKQAMQGESTPIRDFIAIVRRLFGASEAVEIEGDWVDQMAKTYRPGRSSYALPVGVNENGEIQEVAMSGSESHLMVQGVTGTGKTVLINQIICGAALSGLYQVVLVGDSLTDHIEVERLKNVHMVEVGHDLEEGHESGLIHSYPLELVDILRDTVREMKRRKDLMREKKVKKISQIRKRDRPQSVLLIVDEFQNAVMAADTANRSLGRTIQGLTAQIAREGRKFNIHLLLVAQRATKDLSAGLRSQLVMVTYKTKDANESRYATGSGSAAAHTLDEGDIGKRIRPGIVVADQKQNRRLWVEITHDQDFDKLSSMDTSGVGEGPHWLAGYQPPDRTEDVPQLVTMERRTRVPVLDEIVGKPSETEDTGKIITKTTGTGTESTEKTMNVIDVRSWAEHLFETHTDYSNAPARVRRDRVIEIALCGFIGLSENATMRAVFKHTKPEYRSDVKRVFAHMTEAGFVITE